MTVEQYFEEIETKERAVNEIIINGCSGLSFLAIKPTFNYCRRVGKYVDGLENKYGLSLKALQSALNVFSDRYIGMLTRQQTTSQTTNDNTSDTTTSMGSGKTITTDNTNLVDSETDTTINSTTDISSSASGTDKSDSTKELEKNSTSENSKVTEQVQSNNLVKTPYALIDRVDTQTREKGSSNSDDTSTETDHKESESSSQGAENTVANSTTNDVSKVQTTGNTTTSENGTTDGTTLVKNVGDTETTTTVENAIDKDKLETDIALLRTNLENFEAQICNEFKRKWLNPFYAEPNYTIPEIPRLVITKQPESIFGNGGEEYELSCYFDTNIENVQISWYRDGIKVPDANTEIVRIMTPNANTTIEVYCSLYSAEHEYRVTSQTALLTLTERPEITISQQPVGQSVLEDAPFTFNCFATTNAGELTYQWFSNNNIILGANSPTWTGIFDTVGTFKIKCRVINAQYNFFKDTEIALLTVTPFDIPVPVVNIVKDLVDMEVLINTGVDLEIEVESDSSLTYEWFLDNIKQASDTNTFSYVAPNASVHEIYCKVTGRNVYQERVQETVVETHHMSLNTIAEPPLQLIVNGTAVGAFRIKEDNTLVVEGALTLTQGATYTISNPYSSLIKDGVWFIDSNTVNSTITINGNQLTCTSGTTLSGTYWLIYRTVSEQVGVSCETTGGGRYRYLIIQKQTYTRNGKTVHDYNFIHLPSYDFGTINGDVTLVSRASGGSTSGVFYNDFIPNPIYTNIGGIEIARQSGSTGQVRLTPAPFSFFLKTSFKASVEE